MGMEDVQSLTKIPRYPTEGEKDISDVEVSLPFRVPLTLSSLP